MIGSAEPGGVLMASTTKRLFTDEFKREAVSLWETSGRMQTEVAAELGVMPTLLRRWRRKLQESSAAPTSRVARPPMSMVASPADQASAIARLRRELDRAQPRRIALSRSLCVQHGHAVKHRLCRPFCRVGLLTNQGEPVRDRGHLTTGGNPLGPEAPLEHRTYCGYQ